MVQFLVYRILFGICRGEPIQAQLPPALILAAIKQKNHAHCRSLGNLVGDVRWDSDLIVICHLAVKFQRLHRLPNALSSACTGAASPFSAAPAKAALHSVRVKIGISMLF